MKSLILVILSAISLTAFAGGGIGGGGLGKQLQDEIALSLIDEAGLSKTISIPDLGLSPIEVSSDTYRRARIRLSSGLSEINVTSQDGSNLKVKALSGGIVDTLEKSQLVISQ